MIGAFLQHTRTLVVCALVTVFLVVLAASTRWLLADTPAWMMYTAWVVDAQDRTPYVDLIDHHPPVAIAAYLLAGRVFGYSLAGARAADIAGMCAVLALLWTVVRSHGRIAAAGAVAIAGLAHMRGIYMLEREAVAMVPVLAGVLALRPARFSTRTGALVAGIAFGLTPWIKPTMAIAWPFVAGWLWYRRPATPKRPGAKEREGGRRGDRVGAIAAFSLGLVLAAVPVMLYLLAAGSLGAFVDIARHLWPAYAAYAWVPVDWESFARATPLRWLAPAAAGAWMAWRSGDQRQREFLELLSALAIAYTIYPALGHFWANEWLPLQYVTIALAAGLLVHPRQASLRDALVLMLFVVFVSRYVWLPDEFLRQLTTGSPHSPELSASLGVASALETRGGPALRVQPLDYNDGALTVMLAARSTPATSFIWDPSALPDSPYVQTLRERLVAELTARPPDVLIWSEYSIASATSAGNETYRRLETFMRAYRPVLRTPSLVVYERHVVDGAGASQPLRDSRSADNPGR